jgi:hypothetical protein
MAFHGVAADELVGPPRNRSRSVPSNLALSPTERTVATIGTRCPTQAPEADPRESNPQSAHLTTVNGAARRLSLGAFSCAGGDTSVDNGHFGDDAGGACVRSHRSLAGHPQGG